MYCSTSTSVIATIIMIQVSGGNLLARFGHTATAVSHSARLADVVLFGGNVEVLEDKKSKYKLIADTTVLTFGRLVYTSESLCIFMHVSWGAWS